MARRKASTTETGALAPVSAGAPASSADLLSLPVVDSPAHWREHPEKLTGQALRDLAHKRGLARSSLDEMTDDKIREQIRYIDYRRASED